MSKSSESREQWLERCKKEDAEKDAIEQEADDIFDWLDGDENSCYNINYGIAIKTKTNGRELTHTIINELYCCGETVLFDSMFKFNILNTESKLEFFIGSCEDGEPSYWGICPACDEDILTMLQDIKKDILSWSE